MTMQQQSSVSASSLLLQSKYQKYHQDSATSNQSIFIVAARKAPQDILYDNRNGGLNALSIVGKEGGGLEG